MRIFGFSTCAALVLLGSVSLSSGVMAQQTPSGIAATAGSAVQSSSRPPEEVIISRTKANVAKAKRPKAKAKKSKKAAKSKVPTTVTLTNARESTMREFLVGPQEKKAVIKIAKPLAPGASTTLKVGKGATCDMVAIATFEMLRSIRLLLIFAPIVKSVSPIDLRARLEDGVQNWLQVELNDQ